MSLAMEVHTAPRGERQVDLCESEVSLVYTEHYRTARAVQRDFHLNQKQKQTTKNMRQIISEGPSNSNFKIAINQTL